MKKWLIRIGLAFLVIALGAGGFIAIIFYEMENRCEISFKSNFPYMECSRGVRSHNEGVIVGKPIILFYPQNDLHINVSLNYIGNISATFPQYDSIKQGWSVIAHPDGTLRDSGTHQDTYGLFWEGNGVDGSVFDLSKGFIVRGSDIREFLYAKLTEIGLNTKEKSDFIMYWYPKLQEYPYIQITFAGKDYTNLAKLDISPKPDSLLRVFMVAKPLTESIQIPEQKLQKFERKGFSVVEWGGTVVE